MNSPKPTTLVATLGGQPQVVTLALDALLAQGVPVSELILLYLSPENNRIQNALQKVAAEFADGRYGERPLHYRPFPIRTGTYYLHDIHDEADANTAWDAVHQLIAQLKTERRTLHICISGGRRILGLLTMSAAMLHFGHQDVLWHMYTPDDTRRQANEGAIMHLPPDSGFRLIRVPMMPWGSYFPALRELAQPHLPTEDVLAGPRRFLDKAEAARCTAVLNRLTDRQKDVLLAFAEGLNPQQVAEKLFISIKTVDTHKTVILAECRNEWNLSEDTYLDYRFLADKFEILLD
ncbi:MAG: histidine kinase [Ardenticatenaceae bacterium]|nr:histidine kinase [Ardenticatenaceae bacterium]MCB9445606.1 histidine kinase [Ardenticatenaceae bacterium]